MHMKFADLDKTALLCGVLAVVAIKFLWELEQQDTAIFLLSLLATLAFIKSYSKK